MTNTMSQQSFSRRCRIHFPTFQHLIIFEVPSMIK